MSTVNVLKWLDGGVYALEKTEEDTMKPRHASLVVEVLIALTVGSYRR